MTDLHPSTPAWDAEALWHELEPLLPGLAVEVVARADSTSTQLMQRLRGLRGGPVEDSVLPGRRAGDTQPCLLVAEHQTAGRGRLGRSWQSAPGGASLTFSLALPLEAEDWSGLSLAVGVAVAEALDDPAGAPRVTLKWPNDLWLDERKLAGILIESLTIGSKRMAVIGIGINIMPPESTALAGASAGLIELDPAASAPRALHRVALPLVRALKRFEREGFAAFEARYAARDALLDRPVRVGASEGIARGVAPGGALRFETAAGVQLVNSNEVSVRPNAWGPTAPSTLT